MKQRTRRRGKLAKLTHRRTQPGASPGSVVVDPQAKPTRIRIHRYSAEKFEEVNSATLDDIRNSVGKFPVTWVDVEGLGDQKTIERLGEFFALHRLALEDVVNLHQRAKVEEYGDLLYVVVPMVCDNDRFHTEQISLFLGKNVVLTFQEGTPGDAFELVRARLRGGTGKIRSLGADYLAYALVDAVIDGYFPALEKYGEKLDVLEDAMIDDAHPISLIDELHEIRHDLRQIRRNVWPQREAMASLLREGTIHVTDNTRVFLRDCYDHVIQLIDIVETYRELSADLRDLHMSSVSNRINETMRVLTIISTIFIPLTFIAGIYGMNFDHMPELHWTFGYPLALVLMAVTTIGMLVMFYRKGWIRLGRKI